MLMSVAVWSHCQCTVYNYYTLKNIISSLVNPFVERLFNLLQSRGTAKNAEIKFKVEACSQEADIQPTKSSFHV